MRRELKDRHLVGMFAVIRDVKPPFLVNYDVDWVKEVIRYSPVRLTLPGSIFFDIA